MLQRYFKLILLMFIVAHFSYAQQNYIELESGERVYSNKIKIRGSIAMGNAELETDDGKRYVVSYQVDHYFEDGITYKKGFLIGLQAPGFFKLEQEGTKASLYFKTVLMKTGAFLETRKVYYYSKKDSLMLPMKLKYELKDLADSPASMQILRKAKSNRAVANAFYFAGSTLIVAGMINFASQQSNSKTAGALFIAGVASFSVGVPINKSKGRKQIQAVRVYNN